VSDSGDDSGRATLEGHEGDGARADDAGRERPPGLGGCANAHGSYRTLGVRRRALLAACAALVAAIALGVPGSGCLNPRPEELPSGSDPDLLPATEPMRETCEDNPLLAGCDLPDEDINGNPIDAPPADLNDPGAPEPQPSSTPEAGASTSGAGGGDAGSDVPADAGAP
jgi:hypothetical protein